MENGLEFCSFNTQVRELFSFIDRTGEPAQLFISPELGDWEELIKQIQLRGLRMAPVPPGCISIFPPLPIPDEELFYFCREYCIGSESAKEKLRSEWYCQCVAPSLVPVNDPPAAGTEDEHAVEEALDPIKTMAQYNTVIHIAELCLLAGTSPPSVVKHLYASSPYLQISPVREICSAIGELLVPENRPPTEESAVLRTTSDLADAGSCDAEENESDDVKDKEGASLRFPLASSASAVLAEEEAPHDLTGSEIVDDPALTRPVVYFSENDFPIVSESGTFYNPFTGQIAAVYVKGGMDMNLCQEAAESLTAAATTNNLRAKTNGGTPPETGIVGYYDYLTNATTRKCRETEFMRKHFSQVHKGCSCFLKSLDALYAKVAPAHHSLQKNIIPFSYQLVDTVFSTVTVNRNFRTASHTDKGDFKSGLAALCVVKGQYRGCHLAVPALHRSFSLQPGDVLFFDASQIHGNTEVYPVSKEASTWERISLVCYLRNGLLSAVCEAERRKVLNAKVAMGLFKKNMQSDVIDINGGEEGFPPVVVPKQVALKLVTGQLSALSFIADRVIHGSGCILSMAMGLGKTLIALTFSFSTFYFHPEEDILVVAPKTCISNWRREMAKWSPLGLHFAHSICADGTPSSGYQNKIFDYMLQRQGGNNERNGHLIILNPELVPSFAHRCPDFRPQLIIVDEGHCLGSERNQLGKHLDAFGCPRRIVLTGTPLQNAATELYRLVGWVYKDIEAVLPRQRFTMLENIIKEYIAGYDEAYEAASTAQAYLNDWMKAFVFREVDRELPALSDYLLICGSSATQANVSITLGNGAYDHRPGHLSAHPLCYYLLINKCSALKKRSREEEDELLCHNDSCATSRAFEASLVEQMDSSPTASPPSSPTQKWTNSVESREETPAQTLEVSIPSRPFHPPHGGDGSEEIVPESTASRALMEEKRKEFEALVEEDHRLFASHSGKLTALLQIVQYVSKTNEKLIVFAQYVCPQEIIYKTLQQAGFSVFWMRGDDSQETRLSAISDFAKLETSGVLILSSKIAALGHDFTEANHVILFDSWWNPQGDAQAIARAYRRNQTKPVTVYRLASAAGDESIIRAQLRKLALFEWIIHNRPSRLSQDGLTDCSEVEKNKDRLALWASLKDAKLYGTGEGAVLSIYKYTDVMKEVDE